MEELSHSTLKKIEKRNNFLLKSIKPTKSGKASTKF